MEGRNELHLCDSEMTKAVEFYLKQQVFKDEKFKVMDIRSIQDGFAVRLEGLGAPVVRRPDGLEQRINEQNRARLGKGVYAGVYLDLGLGGNRNSRPCDRFPFISST